METDLAMMQRWRRWRQRRRRGASRVEAAQRMWKRWQRVYSSVQVEGGRRGGARNFSILMRGVHTALEIKDRRTGTAESDNFVFFFSISPAEFPR